MSDNNVLKLSQPSTFSDPLTEVLRSGARSLLARAVEAEVAAFLDGHSEARTEEGRRRLVRHGHLPEREIMTGIGPVAVRAPRVRDRTGQGAERIRFSSALLPPYARRSKSLEVLIPVLYLTGNRSCPTSRSGRNLSQAIAPAPPSGSPADCTTAAAAFRRLQGCRAHAALLAVHRRALIMCVRAIASRTGYAPVARLPRLPVRIGSENRAGGLTECSRSRRRPDRSPGACAPPDSMRASRKVDVFCSDSIEVEER